jgi:hypothetical protein
MEAALTGATDATLCSLVSSMICMSYIHDIIIFLEPASGYHGANLFQMCGNSTFAVRARIEGLRDLGFESHYFNQYKTMIECFQSLPESFRLVPASSGP